MNCTDPDRRHNEDDFERPSALREDEPPATDHLCEVGARRRCATWIGERQQAGIILLDLNMPA